MSRANAPNYQKKTVNERLKEQVDRLEIALKDANARAHGWADRSKKLEADLAENQQHSAKVADLMLREMESTQALKAELKRLRRRFSIAVATAVLCAVALAVSVAVLL